MRAQLFFEGPQVREQISRFWLLLVLSAVIASAGVAGDSTATVIGAMIVAPLMSPILGIVLAMVLNDRRNLLRSVGTVVAGACAVIVIAYVIGLAKVEPVTAMTNSQVAARVSPKLIDLLGALATGAVGSVALVRSDISDTLPGVAIAISLVPPLSVVGLTLESGAPSEARGALLLFIANVSAILATGVVVMALYGVLGAHPSRPQAHRWRRPGVGVIAALVIIVAVPLAISSVRTATSSSQQATLTRVVTQWADARRWSVASIDAGADEFTVRVIGEPPAPDAQQLHSELDGAGLGSLVVRVDLIPEHEIVLRPR